MLPKLSPDWSRTPREIWMTPKMIKGIQSQNAEQYITFFVPTKTKKRYKFILLTTGFGFVVSHHQDDAQLVSK